VRPEFRRTADGSAAAEPKDGAPLPPEGGSEVEPEISSLDERGPFRRLLGRVLSDKTLSQKASLNMVAAILDYGARVVVGLVLNPILVSRLGDLAFGVYQVLARLIGYTTPAGGRPSQALKWTIAHDQYSDHYDEKRQQVGSAIVVWFLFLPLLAVTGAILAWFAPLLVDVPASLHLTIRVAAGLLVLEVIATNLLTIPQSVLQGENLGYKRMGLTTAVLVVGGGLTATAAILGMGLVGVAGATLATTVLTGLVFWWVTRRYVPWFGAARPALGAVWTFMRLSGWFLLWNLVMQLLRGSDVVVLGIAGAAELVTVYTLSRYVPEAIFGAVAIVIAGIMPGLGGLIGAADRERAAKVRSESMAVTWLIATASGATFLLWQQSFLRLWVGEKYYPGRVATLLIIVMVFQFAFIRNDASIIDLTLNLRAKVLLGIVSAGVSIGIAVLLIRQAGTGISGLAAGFIAGRSILTVAYPSLVSGYLGTSMLAQLRGAVRALLVSAALFASAVFLSPLIATDSWVVLVAFSALSLAVLGVSAFRIGLTPSQRRRVSQRVRQVLGGS
jgi:O-antigen/teichoic acid export membrane protein